MSNSAHALYVHIPFCEHICGYCDFTKMIYNSAWVEDYLSALKQEIVARAINPGDIRTVYIGGGTPSALNLKQLERLFVILAPYMAFADEKTIELNVENTDLSKLELFKTKGINRLSVGVQSFDDNVLKACDRKHTGEDALTALKLIKDIGFTNFSLDLIYGLPGQTPDSFWRDLQKVIALSPPHVSLYSLTVNPGTLFSYRQVKEISEDDSLSFYRLATSFLRANGYERYEVSNFAKEGYYSRHNLAYWRNQHYYGVGLGASGYVDNSRYQNTRNFKKYLSGAYLDEVETITSKDEIEYYLLTNLRLQKGFSLDEFQQLFCFDFLEKFAKPLDNLISNKLVVIDDNRLFATDEGTEKLNYVLLSLITIL